ncbi:tRNA (adenine(22)-N(1))-methyltransferase [Peribacillus deserti]|uniref:tRNA (Adenine(22)-N(1))-methyltransferase TrmK n=1 Tax=Peribacillus deserti TaxID=673318 RepID=A0A2N5M9F8_9BACI|nr:tRNA (adenine(22)-N(1))-methyltransferase TrmK [Peribacillus deserti]PLT30984.1 tRNA (adenine(22)-N(1))-methyltransferase TrmK [Peribacillus deserti]
MNVDRLSKRLEAVASYIPKGSILADIGSDHAYLPCYALNKEIIKKGIAGEVSEGPLKSAQNQVRASGLTERIDVRKGDGLEVISPDEVDCITIAGMGGTLISTILEQGRNKLKGVKRLILQPNIGARNVRIWLLENGWELIQEEILEEDQKIYEILVAEPGNPNTPYDRGNRDASLLMGPFLIQEKNPIFEKKWALEKAHMQRILIQIEKSGQGSELAAKKVELRDNINIVEEILKS